MPVSQERAAAALVNKVPGVVIDLDELFVTPEFIFSERCFLTAPTEPAVPNDSRASAVGLVRAFVESNVDLFRHDSSIFNAAVLTSEHTTAGTAMRTLVWQQQLDGIPLFETSFVAHITRSNELVSVSSHFLPDPAAASKLTRDQRSFRIVSPTIDAAAAVVQAAAVIEEPTSENWLTRVISADAERRRKFEGPGLIGEAIAELTWLPLNDSELRLCWRVTLTAEESKRAYQVLIDTETGEDWLRHSLTRDVTPTYYVYASGSPTPMSPGHSTPSTVQPAPVGRGPVTINEVSTLMSDPWLPTSAIPPLKTTGNNVDARTDRENLDLDYGDQFPPGSIDVRGTSDSNGIFNPVINLALDPVNYKEAAVVNAFYWANWMHDKLYDLGLRKLRGIFSFRIMGGAELETTPSS